MSERPENTPEDLSPLADEIDSTGPVGELVRYADRAMFEAEPIEGSLECPTVTLLHMTPDPLGVIAAMCAMYEGRVVRRLSDLSNEDRKLAWDNVNRTHLKAPLESVDLMFLLEGVTRAFTHQLVRQRTAVYAQESLRFAVKEEIAARPGPLISSDPAALKMWDGMMEGIWDGYRALIANGIPAEEARGLLPHDTLTRVIYKTNLRNLLEHAGNRLCTQAQFEWRLVFGGIVQAIQEYVPTVGGESISTTRWQFIHIASAGVFKPVCFTLGHCPFTADFDRGCTIRDRVDAGQFEDIEPVEWLADPTAGWVR